MALMNNPMAAGEEEKNAEEQVEGDEKEVGKKVVDFEEAGRRYSRVMMDVYTGKYTHKTTN